MIESKEDLKLIYNCLTNADKRKFRKAIGYSESKPFYHYITTYETVPLKPEMIAALKTVYSANELDSMLERAKEKEEEKEKSKPFDANAGLLDKLHLINEQADTNIILETALENYIYYPFINEIHLVNFFVVTQMLSRELNNRELFNKTLQEKEIFFYVIASSGLYMEYASDIIEQIVHKKIVFISDIESTIHPDNSLFRFAKDPNLFESTSNPLEWLTGIEYQVVINTAKIKTLQYNDLYKKLYGRYTPLPLSERQFSPMEFIKNDFVSGSKPWTDIITALLSNMKDNSLDYIITVRNSRTLVLFTKRSNSRIAVIELLNDIDHTPYILVSIVGITQIPLYDTNDIDMPTVINYLTEKYNNMI